MKYGMLVVMGLMAVAGCATTRGDKPVLTARAAGRIARACHAVSGKTNQGVHDALPYASFVLPQGASSADDGVAPMVSCLHRELSAYRHAMMSLAEQPGAAAD